MGENRVGGRGGKGQFPSEEEWNKSINETLDGTQQGGGGSRR